MIDLTDKNDVQYIMNIYKEAESDTETRLENQRTRLVKASQWHCFISYVLGVAVGVFICLV